MSVTNNNNFQNQKITNEQLAQMIINLEEQIQEMNDKISNFYADIGISMQTQFLKLDKIYRDMNKRNE